MGTSGSTPLHFAAANGNSDVVTLLLLHGAHADRADKHGITPEMLAQQNGWVECVKVLNDWILNKDQDLRDREGYDARPGSSTGQHSHDQEPSHPADAVSSFSSRKGLTVKQSIDTALNKLKYTDSQSRTTHSSVASTPPSPPPRPFGEYSFYPADPSASPPFDSTVRRPSLPHVLQVHSNEHISDQNSSLSDSLPKSSYQRRPRSAGTGSDQTPEQEVTFSIYGRGGYGRKLGSKYSLLNIFKKAQPGEASGSSGNVLEAISTRDSPDNPLSITQSHSGQPSTSNLNDNPNPTSAPRPGLPHRGSDVSNKSTRLIPQTHSVSSSTMTRKASGLLRTPPRSNIPLALELVTQQQPRIRHTVSGTPNDVSRPVLDADERGKPSSPLARFTPIHSGHNRGTSVTSLNGTPDTNSTQDNSVVITSDATLELESGKPSPSPRPGILRAYNRTSSTGQGSASNSRTLRFDPSPSNDRKVRDRTADSPMLKSYDSSGSLSKFKVQTNGVDEQELSSTLMNVCEEDNYGVPIVPDMDIGTSLEKTLNVPSVLLQRQRGQSFASSSESSLSPILTGDNVADPNMTAINADFPFSINRPPSIATVDHEDFPSPRGLLSPVSSDTRNRGDSLSSDSSTSNPQLSFTSGSGASQLVFTPANASIFPQDNDKFMSLVQDEVLGPIQDYKGCLNERRAHAPLDIDITSVSSHAQAEALVERARREALDWASTPDFSPPSSGTGRSPLSARLAAYGESLALERKLREQKEQTESTWKDVQSRNAPSLVLSPLTSITILKGPDGVERQLSLDDKPSIEKVRRHKDPRRPSTADGGTLKFLEVSYIFALTLTLIVHSPNPESNSTGPLASHHHPSYSTPAKHDHDTQNRPPLQLTSNSETIPPYTVIPISSMKSDFNQSVTSRTLAPPDQSRVTSFDGGTDTEPESPTLFRVSTPPLSNTVRGKREVRTANKLMRMGYPANEQTTSRTSPPSPPTSRFGVIKSFVQTFKGKT